MVPEIRGKYEVEAVVTGAVVGCALGLSASAQDATTLQQDLNQAGICAELPELDFTKVASLVGFELPIPDWLPIDLGARWDKDHHRVTAYSHNEDGVRAEIEFDCRPSTESAVLKAMPLSDEDVALTDRATCEGKASDGAVLGLECRVSGEIGKFLATYIDLDDRVSGAIGRTLDIEMAQHPRTRRCNSTRRLERWTL